MEICASLTQKSEQKSDFCAHGDFKSLIWLISLPFTSEASDANYSPWKSIMLLCFPIWGIFIRANLCRSGEQERCTQMKKDMSLTYFDSVSNSLDFL